MTWAIDVEDLNALALEIAEKSGVGECLRLATACRDDGVRLEEVCPPACSEGSCACWDAAGRKASELEPT
jgi:hypothetical protein